MLNHPRAILATLIDGGGWRWREGSKYERDEKGAANTTLKWRLANPKRRKKSIYSPRASWLKLHKNG